MSNEIEIKSSARTQTFAWSVHHESWLILSWGWFLVKASRIIRFSKTLKPMRFNGWVGLFKTNRFMIMIAFSSTTNYNDYLLTNENSSRVITRFIHKPKNPTVCFWRKDNECGQKCALFIHLQIRNASHALNCVQNLGKCLKDDTVAGTEYYDCKCNSSSRNRQRFYFVLTR